MQHLTRAKNQTKDSKTLSFGTVTVNRYFSSNTYFSQLLAYNTGPEFSKNMNTGYIVSKEGREGWLLSSMLSCLENVLSLSKVAESLNMQVE